jgi:diguanylate cyclase (GGDEF)-like protein/putative nucleotidyltransferase with HDIG domain
LKADDPKLGVSHAPRIALILWGIGGIAGIVWAAFYLDRLNPGVFAVLVLAVVVPVLVLSYYSYHLYLRTLENVKKHASEMGDLFNSTLSTLALAIDAKDTHTHGHTRRVQTYARAIAEAMNLDADQIKAVVDAALLHDIGKLAIPEFILNKRGSLTPEEMRKMRMHPQFGADIIANIKFPYPVSDSILAHHERFDGQGYPSGLCGKNIPLGARILAVADSFDGYVSERLESPETLEGAMQLVRDGCGTAFDPEVVEAWKKIYNDVLVWPSNAESHSHTGIQQASSELKMLETLEQSIEGLTSVQDIFSIVRTRIMKWITGCTVSIERGAREGIPVVFGDKVIATVNVHRSQPLLNEDELRLIHAVAETMAPMLSNALAIEEARREATLDRLTGLANRRAFEMMSASLHRQQFSIVLIDVNCFKAVNDNFGHTAGDATLMRIAAHLRAAFHDAQLTCRLGGDEFLVLSVASVRSIRAQIRHFRQMVVWDPAHDAYRKLMFGVSCGLATIPVDAQNIEQALQRADERMYAIKTRFKKVFGGAIPSSTESKARPKSNSSKGINRPLALKR